MGGRLLRHWLSFPLIDLTEIHRRQSVVTGEEMLFDSELPSDLSELLDRWRTYAAQVDSE